MNIELIKKYIEIKTHLKHHSSEADKFKAQAIELEEQIIEEFNQDGINRITVDGKTVYVSKTIWPKIIDKQKAIDILKASEYSHYISESYNTKQLASLLRELVEEEGKLPDSFAGYIEISEVYKPKMINA